MKKDELIIGVVVEKSQALTLEEFCSATKADKDLVMEMIEYQLVHPEGEQPTQWRFDSISLRRGRIASSFYHELEVNMPGVALALELLDKIEEIQREIDILQKK
jgi:chaperone modulatory protein CbpM